MSFNTIKVNSTDTNYTHSIFDISEYTGKTYDTLTDALADVPDGKQKGGMTVSFVSTSGNKYVEYFCKAQSFTTTPSAWQLKNDTLLDMQETVVSVIGRKYDKVFDINDADIRTGIINVAGYTWENSGEHYFFPVLVGEKVAVKAGAGVYTAVAFLSSDSKVAGQVAPIVNNSFGAPYDGAIYEHLVPEGAKYCYIAKTITGTDRTPQYVKFLANIKVDNTPQKTSTNLISSGAVAESLDKIDAFYNVSTNNGGAMFASLYALLHAVNIDTLIPESVRKEGMAIKFIDSNSGRYRQFRLATRNWSINSKDWKEIADKTDLTSCINYDNTNILKKLIDASIQTANLAGVTITNNGNGTYTLNGTSNGHVSVELVADKSATSEGYFTLEDGARYKARCKPISGTTSRTPYMFLKYCGGSSNIVVLGKTSIIGTGGQIGRFAINIQAADVTFDNYVIAPYLALESEYSEDYCGYTNLIIDKSLEPDFNSNALVPAVGIHQYINKKVLGVLYSFTINTNTEGITPSAISKNEDVYIAINNPYENAIQCKLALYDTLLKSDVYTQDDYTEVAGYSTVDIHLDSTITIACNEYTVLRLIAVDGTVLKYAVISSDAVARTKQDKLTDVQLAALENAKVIGPLEENTLTSFKQLTYRINNTGSGANNKWDAAGKHDVIPAIPGRTYTIKGCASYGFYQWLRSYSTPVPDELADISVIDPRAYQTYNGQIITLTCPSDATYLYFLTAVAADDRRPEYIKENAMASQFVMLDARISLIESDVSILNAYANKFVKQDTTNVLKSTIELSGNRTGAGVTVTKNQDGTYTLNGTSTSPVSIELVADKSSGTTGYFELEESVQYYGILKVLSGTASAKPYMFLKYCGGSSNIIISGKTSIVGTGGQIGRFAINIQAAGRTFNNYVVAPYVAKATEYADGYDGFNYLEARQSGITEVEKVNLVPSLQKELLMQEDYVTEALKSIYSSALSDGYDVAIGLFADPHSIDYLKYRKYRYLKEHGITLFNICLGDVEPYSLIGSSKPVVISKMQEAISISGLTDTDLYTIGNHDAAINNPNNGVLLQSHNLTKREWYNLFMKHLSKSAVFDSANPMGGYYYTDFNDANLRVIVLNTSEIYENDGTLSKKYTESVVVRQHQIDWLINKALDFTDKEEPSSWHVLVCGHSSFLQNFIAEILAAVKQGTSVNTSTTVNKMLTYDSSTNSWGSPVDASGSFVLTANKDFSGQGSVDVIAQLYGHVHDDTYSLISGIATLQFVCDNGELDNCMMIPVQGVTAGNYKFVYRDKTFYFAISEDDASATAIAINVYHYTLNYMYGYIYHGNDRSLSKFVANTTERANATDITPSTYTPERHSGTITTESGKFITFDYANRKLRIYGIGVCGNHVLDY